MPFYLIPKLFLLVFNSKKCIAYALPFSLSHDNITLYFALHFIFFDILHTIFICYIIFVYIYVRVLQKIYTRNSVLMLCMWYKWFARNRLLVRATVLKLLYNCLAILLKKGNLILRGFQRNRHPSKCLASKITFSKY